jgi:hypothetical protein
VHHKQLKLGHQRQGLHTSLIHVESERGSNSMFRLSNGTREQHEKLKEFMTNANVMGSNQPMKSKQDTMFVQTLQGLIDPIVNSQQDLQQHIVTTSDSH